MTPIPTCIAHPFPVAVRPVFDLVLGLPDTIDLVSGKRPVRGGTGAITWRPDGGPGLRRTAPPWRARGGGCRTPRQRARARPAPWRRAAPDRRGARAAR